VKNIVTEDFRTLLEDHAQRVRRFQDRGWVPAVGSSPEARIEATRAFYASAYGRRPGRALLTQAIAGTAFSLTVLAAALVWLDLAR
jgi:hypothetical protein